MTFGEKLKKIRTDRNLTQEELAEKIFVTRTAVSKWESGKGYPNIDSLKEIANFFGVTIDALLSSEEVLTIAEADTKKSRDHLYSLVFGLVDASVLMLLFLPFFGQDIGGEVVGISLLSLDRIPLYLKLFYFIFVIGIGFYGLITLAFQNAENCFWIEIKRKFSLLFSSLAVVLFVISHQAYAAIFLFFICAIKTLVLIKWK